jgi:acyl-CoA synthetase (NDP forming)
MQVYDSEELTDLVLLFQHLGPVRGRKLGLVGGGGGAGVLVTDNCVREGLMVPSFPDGLKRRLREILPKELDPGTSVRNPVDFSMSWLRPGVLQALLETMAKYDGIDFTLIHFTLVSSSSEVETQLVNSIIETKRKLSKPIVMVLRHDHAPQVRGLVLDLQKRCAQAGMPVFSSFDRAARAISRFVRYHEERQS